MNPIDFAVAVPPDPPDEEAALDAALGTTAGLFDDCSPLPNDDPVIGTLDPWGNSGRALGAACRATVEQEPGFSVVNVIWESPASLPTIDPPDLGFFELPRHRSEVERYGYVVTSADVTNYVTVGAWQTPVSTERYRTFSLTRKGTWKRSDFASHCGDAAYFGGGSPGTARSGDHQRLSAQQVATWPWQTQLRGMRRKQAARELTRGIGASYADDATDLVHPYRSARPRGVHALCVGASGIDISPARLAGTADRSDQQGRNAHISPEQDRTRRQGEMPRGWRWWRCPGPR